MLKLNPTFDTRKDVVSSILAKEETVRGNIGVLDPRILNVEKDGSVVYSWRGATGTTRIGKYDPHSTENKLLYTFDKQVCVSSCSLNKEETLLAVSLSQTTQEGGRLKPVSKCLTLLIEIHPINNTKVLKAVDCRVKVQFLYPKTCRTTVLESHLLLAAEDGYVDQYHITLTRQEGYRVVMLNPERLGRDRVAEEFNWIQWDSDTQRLFYLTSREKHTLKCVQFYPDRNYETVFELPLEMPSITSITSVRFVNFGYDHYKEKEEEGLRLEVFTDPIGTMCVCYSHPVCWNKDATYTIAFVHRGCSKTFTVSLEKSAAPANEPKVYPIFIHLGYYIVVYLANHFLHLINCRQQDLLCYSLFLSGADGPEALGSGSEVVSVSGRRLLDVRAGKMYTMELNHDFLFELLSLEKPEAQRLAALHCLLVYLQPNPVIDLKIINWISENVMSFDAFDQIQEFILASLYRISYQQCVSLDKVLPYSCVFEKKELPIALTAIPGVKCTPELLCQPLIKGKGKSLHGYWEELHHVLDRMRYFEAVPGLRFRTTLIKEEWGRFQASMHNSEKKKSPRYNRHIEENTKKVLSMVDTWRLDRRVVPLFQEEDQQQRALVGLMVDKLREHLNRHLPRLGKKKIDLLVVNYAAKLLELVWHLLELVWQKLELGPWVLCLKQQGCSEEWAMFHMMFRILEATKGLCFPLPPGYSTLLSVLGVRCLPQHTFLQYVDHGLLQLTEPFVSRLMTDLDNSDANEQLKFSILKRLPECMKQKVSQQWDHPITSAWISREYVKMLLEKYPENRDSISLDNGKMCFHAEFLPLNYLAKILSDREEQAENPFEEQENVDVRFVEETALKQTLIKLGFEVK
ncbi:gamma-secretase-activating protein isoform X1 [Misgurnus anguillicaudatus]|uniref:gamma-secretase-activating protein isoform X1 n=1 Tax=Misgurnus anguillicaudatus TaxID=75329 RepID=UPI003CCF1440